MNKIVKAIFFVFGFPQNLIGLIMLFVLMLMKKIDSIEKYKESTIYWVEGWDSGISLGFFIFLGTPFKRIRTITIRHEYGHTVQSIILGIFYLLIVGLPSITFNIISRFNEKFHKNYYNRFPENWADRLEGIERKETI